MSPASRVLTICTSNFARYGDLVYTERQLYYEVCRTLRPTPGLDARHVSKALLVGALPALLFWRRPRRMAAWLLADAAVVQGLRLLRHWPFTLSPSITFEQFQEALHGAQKWGGPLSNLLSSPQHQPATVDAAEPDLLDYGLSRLLVCQQPQVAAMLRANVFHVELGCPVLTIAEASPLPDALLAMLRRVDGARVFFLHNASPEGLSLVLSLRQTLGLDKEIKLTAMGLRPIHALRLHLFAQRKGLTAPASVEAWPPYLSAKERAWLQAGHHTETEALHPVYLMRALRQIMLGTVTRPGPRLSLHRERELGFLSWPQVDHRK